MSRHANDLYPTTPEAAVAVGLVLADRFPDSLQLPWVDPAAGFGTLPKWAGIPRELRHAIELSRDIRQLAELAQHIPGDHLRVGVDALGCAWPRANIIANPPFVMLDEFVERILVEVALHHLVAAILTPVNFWHAQGRAKLRAPELFVALGWRPNFSCGLKADGSDGSGPSQDYVWAIYAGRPTGKTEWVRVERPAVDRTLMLEHERLARIAVGAELAPPPLFRLLADAG